MQSNVKSNNKKILFDREIDYRFGRTALKGHEGKIQLSQD